MQSEKSHDGSPDRAWSIDPTLIFATPYPMSREDAATRPGREAPILDVAPHAKREIARREAGPSRTAGVPPALPRDQVRADRFHENRKSTPCTVRNRAPGAI